MSKSKTAANTKLQIDLESLKKAGLVLRALNHPVRQKMLNLIDSNKEMKVTDIYKRLKLEQSITSSYLALLRRAGLVQTRREGQVINYSVNYTRISEVQGGAKIING